METSRPVQVCNGIALHLQARQVQDLGSILRHLREIEKSGYYVRHFCCFFFLLVIPRHLNSMCQRSGTLCLVHLSQIYEDGKDRMFRNVGT